MKVPGLFSNKTFETIIQDSDFHLDPDFLKRRRDFLGVLRKLPLFVT